MLRLTGAAMDDDPARAFARTRPRSEPLTVLAGAVYRVRGARRAGAHGAPAATAH